MSDNAKPQSIDRPVPAAVHYLALLVVALLAVVLGELISLEFVSMDQLISGRVLAIGGINTTPYEELAGRAAKTGHAIEFCLALLLSAGAGVASWKLPALGRFAVLVQLIVLALLTVFVLGRWLGYQSHVLVYVVAVLVMFASGYALRLMEKSRKQRLDQYYELLLRNQELTDARLQLVKQDEVERRLLAADLHDQVLNDLKAINQLLKNDCEQSEFVRSIEKHLQMAISETRSVMDSLSPSVLEHFGLATAIDDCLTNASERAGFRGKFQNRSDASVLDSLSTIEQTLLYRLIQESLTNICKHAKASRVKIVMNTEEDQLIIRIEDDGMGFDFKEVGSNSRGLKFMRQRADLVGATLAWMKGEDGKGTVVAIRKRIKS